MIENRSTASTLRIDAWNNLKGNWRAMSTATFLSSLIFLSIIVPAIVAIILSTIIGIIVFCVALILLILFGGAFTLGTHNMSCLVASGQNVLARQMFSGFRHFFKTFSASLLNGLFMLLWSIIPLVGMVVSIIFMTTSADSTINLIFTICTILFSALTLSIITFKGLSYSMTFYVLAKDNSISANKARLISCKLMEGNKFRLVRLQETFMGWYLLCILTLGLAYFWVKPYIDVTIAKMFNELISKNQYLFD